MIETILAILTVVVALVLWAIGAKLIRESVQTVTIWDYQTGLHWKNGRFVAPLEAGKHRLWGRGHAVVVYDNRISELVVQGQELITTDSAAVKLTVVVQWKIGDALRFHLGSDDASRALYTLVQLALRRVVGGLELDAVLERKVDFGSALRKEVDETARAELGIEVVRIEVRDVILGGELKSAYAGVLTARKEAQAKQERARGDAAALRTFANAARAFENRPELFRLRYLETLEKAGAGYGNQLVIGVPEELLATVKKEA